ncbi:MAG: DMT family transporter [Clostridiales bacterium]|nr:DMT family transporter [Clostridiales bacterium]
MDKKSIRGMILILLAGILWGCMGLFVRPLDSKGLNSLDLVCIRAVLTAVFMGLFILIKSPSLFKIKLKDLWCFLGTGIVSIVFFNICYFYEITITSLSVAAILLYTSPAFVMVISAVLFKEKLTLRKVVSLIILFIGLIFVTGVLGGGSKITLITLLIGLGAGLGYALYSIFGRYCLERGYDTYTISFYTFLFASLATIPFAHMGSIVSVSFSSVPSFGFTVLFVMVTTLIPYLVYTAGLKTTENSKAAIIASIEPVVATLNGILWFEEKISLPVFIGIVLVLAGIVISNKTDKK